MKPQEFLRENEFIGDDAHQMHKSHQLHMLREECYHSAANAIKLHKLLGELPEGHDLDAWAAEKISLANDYLKTVTEWLEYDVMGGTNEAMMAGGMEAFSMESAERQYAELLGEDQGMAEGFTDTLKSVWRGLKAQVVDFAANAVGLPDDQRREVFVQAGNEFSNEVITLLANHPARDKLIPMIREIGGYMAKARTLKEFNSVMDKAGLFLADVEAIKFNPPSGVAKALPSYRDKQGMAEGSKRLPDIRQFDKTVLDKQFGGSMVKMAQALKDAGFSNERILQKISDFKQGVAEGEITRTATGTKHRSTAAYGGTEKDTDHLRTLDKATTNKIDKAIGVKFKKQGRGLDLGETTAAGSVSTVPAVGGGTLFGGNYSNSSSPFKKKSVKKESIIKR